MKFEWDPAKSESNRKKHGIDFNTAKGLWRDEHIIEIHGRIPSRTEVSSYLYRERRRRPDHFRKTFKEKGGGII